jgi:hypothetical protein
MNDIKRIINGSSKAPWSPSARSVNIVLRLYVSAHFTEHVQKKRFSARRCRLRPPENSVKAQGMHLMGVYSNKQLVKTS